MRSALQLNDNDTENSLVVTRSGTIPPLIKWTGSKRSQAREILRQLPPFRRYIEPFVGSGALLYLCASQGSIAGDIYRPLVELWKLIQTSPKRVAESYRIQWMALNAELDRLDVNNLPPNESLPNYFYEVRDRFNRTQDPLDLNFIMRTCVNGIVRFNDKGEFNNSFHLSRRGMKPSQYEKVVASWSSVLRGVGFVCQDYALTLDNAKRTDFVYLDPPYAGNKQRYIGNFDLMRFFTTLERLNRKDVRWALSFDGRRGELSLVHELPRSIYKRHMMFSSGNSAVNKVLNGPVEMVEESLYLNY